MIHNLQFTNDNKFISGYLINSVGPLLFTLAFQAADFDGLFECTHEFGDSLFKLLNTESLRYFLFEALNYSNHL